MKFWLYRRVELREIWISPQTRQFKWDAANGNAWECFIQVYYARQVHLNVVSRYDYRTIVVTPRGWYSYSKHLCLNVITHAPRWGIKLDSVYPRSTYLREISFNYAAFMHYFLGSCITFFARATYSERASERSNLSRWPVRQSWNCILANARLT